MGVSSCVRRQTLSWASERVVFGNFRCIVYTKNAAIRKSVFVQKEGGFENIFFMHEVRISEKCGVLFSPLTVFRVFFAYGVSICENAAFLPLSHTMCPFESYTTSLQKRRNSQVTQRYCVDGAGGISSLSTLRRIECTVCTTFLRRCGVIGICSARLSGME